MEKMRERGCARRRARPNERANERATRRGSAKVGKSRRVPSYRGSAPTERNCLHRHGGVPRGTKCIRLVPVLVNHMERTDADGGMEETRDGVDAGVAGKGAPSVWRVSRWRVAVPPRRTRGAPLCAPPGFARRDRSARRRGSRRRRRRRGSRSLGRSLRTSWRDIRARGARARR